MSTDPSEADVNKVVALRGGEAPGVAAARAWLLPPANAAEAMAAAKMIAESSFVPKEYRGKPGDVLICVQYGAELGIPALQALQGIGVINGKPGIYGDLALAVVLNSGTVEDFREWLEGEGDHMVAHCVGKRRGRPSAIEHTFSVADAKQAGLWGKQGPWSQYPKRMAQMRARAFVLRDGWADHLKGLGIREELADYVEPEPEAPRIEQPRALDVTPPAGGGETPPATAPGTAEPGNGSATTPAAEPTGCITDTQRRELFRTAGDAGRTIADLKAKLESLGIASTAQIPASRFAEILSWAKDEPALPERAPGEEG